MEDDKRHPASLHNIPGHQNVVSMFRDIHSQRKCHNLCISNEASLEMISYNAEELVNKKKFLWISGSMELERINM
jgi:hypothetical protein